MMVTGKMWIACDNTRSKCGCRKTSSGLKQHKSIPYLAPRTLMITLALPTASFEPLKLVRIMPGNAFLGGWIAGLSWAFEPQFLLKPNGEGTP